MLIYIFLVRRETKLNRKKSLMQFYNMSLKIPLSDMYFVALKGCGCEVNRV